MTVLDPIKETEDRVARRPPRLKSVKHIKDPYREGHALCAIKINENGAVPVGDPCIVCLKMANNQRMWQR